MFHDGATRRARAEFSAEFTHDERNVSDWDATGSATSTRIGVERCWTALANCRASAPTNASTVGFASVYEQVNDGAGGYAVTAAAEQEANLVHTRAHQFARIGSGQDFNVAVAAINRSSPRGAGRYPDEPDATAGIQHDVLWPTANVQHDVL
ncbi:unnamed protein product (mitochondrion) [Plasmodiophora brassicae]|uniref:Uncharacterized protein n=1 Tax=Plasmodiophora brassicae TaxID=37360 RepID=A0A3P3YH31_PLABS|nr:unnamed protein product [Plasmodiophora brassicae]